MTHGPASRAPKDEGPIIEVRDLCVNLGGRRVLTHANFDVAQGEIVGITGPNGGGKTTLLRAMLGLVPTCCGSVRYFGEPAHERPRGSITYLAQHAVHVDPAYPSTVQEVVLLGRVAPRGLLRRLGAIDDTFATRALEEVGLAHLARRPIGELSGGQCQRVLLAQAIASQSRILMLDEPTTGVDRAARDEFQHLLARLNREHDLTILLVSHDHDMIDHVAARVFLVEGKLTETTTSPSPLVLVRR